MSEEESSSEDGGDELEQPEVGIASTKNTVSCLLDILGYWTSSDLD